MTFRMSSFLMVRLFCPVNLIGYFRIGEGKLRRLAEEKPTPGWVVMNGNRVQVKRKVFERMIDATDVI